MLLAMLFTALAVPASVFWIGVRWMTKRCDYMQVLQCLQQAPNEQDLKPLNQRWTGYSVNEVLTVWQRLDTDAVKSEQCFLRSDLFFPVAYGTALFLGLWLVWRVLGMLFAWFWLLIPVVLTVLADWTENVVHLQQLRRYIEQGQQGIQAHWIRIASAATIIKLWLFTLTSIWLIGMVLFAGCDQL